MRKVFAFLLIAVLAFLGLVALQPSTWEVSRSATVPAPPATVFAMVNDLHRWDAWSPWTRIDPNVRMTYEGPEAGPGAIVRWAGNRDVGEGSMEIVENRPDERVRLALEFIKPFPGKSDVEFDFDEAPDGTTVTWSMTGHNNLIAKAMCLFMNMDRMIGGDMERGLANMRSSFAAAPPAGT